MLFIHCTLHTRWSTVVKIVGISYWYCLNEGLLSLTYCIAVKVLGDTINVHTRAAPIPGICIGIGPIPAFFNGIRIGQGCYTSANLVVRALLSMKYFFSKSSS